MGDYFKKVLLIEDEAATGSAEDLIKYFIYELKYYLSTITLKDLKTDTDEPAAHIHEIEATIKELETWQPGDLVKASPHPMGGYIITDIDEIKEDLNDCYNMGLLTEPTKTAEEIKQQEEQNKKIFYNYLKKEM